MKKRFISFVLVLTIIFTGAFSCIASADSDTIRRYYDLYKKYFQGLFGLSGELIWDQSFFGDLDDLIDLVGDQQDATDQHDDLDSSLFGYGRLQNVSYFSSGLEHTNWDDAVAVLPDKALKVTIDPHSEFSFFPYCNDFRAYDLQFYHSDQSRYSGWQRYNFWSKSAFIQTNTSDSPLFLYVRFDVLCNDGPIDLSSVTVYLSGGIHWGWVSNEIVFSGTSSEIPGTINLYLTASRDIIPDIDGSYMIGFGLLYDDGNDRMYCGDYIDFRNVSNGDYWESSFNLKEFSQYAYRKRCPLDNYKAFIFVFQDGFVYNKEFPLELDPPGGIFDDIEDPPDFKDYEPDPSEDPSPPHFDSDFIFNYNTNNTTYQSFTWTTINNYNSGGGSGGSGGGGGSSSGGGSGGDSSSGSGDDSSSGADDPGGDSSSGSEPGGDGSFNDWFSDAVVTINNNFNNGLDTLNENIRIIKENTENYFTAVHDYIVSYLHDWFVYIADLLKKFKDDFNAWTSAFGDYLTDTFNVINRNIAVVGDNIVKAIKTQVVPDKDVMVDIVNTHVPGFSDIQSGFNDFEPTDEDLVVSIPLFSQDDSVSKVSSGNDSSDPGVFVFNFSEAFQDPIYGRIRNFGSVVIIGSTLISALNIFLKIFGLGSSSDSD